MTATDVRLETVDLITAPEETLRALARHDEALRLERLPDDPPMPEDAAVAGMRHQEKDFEDRHFVLWDGDQVVGHAGIGIPLTQNTHLAFTGASVLAPYRRRGLGRRLMAEVARYAEQNGRRKLLMNSNSRLPDGEAVLRHLGAEPALEQHTNQLDLSELEPGLLERWIGESEARAADYRIWQHRGPLPEGRLAEFAELFGVMNTAPRGDLDMQDWQMTPEMIRDWEQQLAATGEQTILTFAEHRESGQLVGFTQLFWLPARASILQQGATGVLPEHRRHSLGRWIKAANLKAALEADPQARYVRTGNANSNEGMLGINHAMGFKPFIARTDWQMDTEQLRAYLDRATA